MRYLCPLPMAISSMPMTRGAGQPARRSCSRMYCLSSSLTCMPIEEQFLGDFLDGALSAASAHEEGEPLGVERVVRQPVQAFALHAVAP